MTTQELALKITGDGTSAKSALADVAESVLRLGESINSMEGLAAAAFAAVVSLTGAIVALGMKGSEVNDVASGMDRLAGSSKHADEILQAMRVGVAGTIDDLKLMTDANKLLAVGAVKDAEGFGTLTAAARVLSREGFGPMQEMIQGLSSAMETGRTRRLALMGVTVDAKSAEVEYAASLGKTKAELTASEKLIADRQAVMAALGKTVEDAGEQELSFAEKINQAKVSVENWITSLARAVATSPQVNEMLDAIKDGFNKAFGGDSQTLLDAIIAGINRFAEVVTEAVPYVVALVGYVKDLLGIVRELWPVIEGIAAGFITYQAATGLAALGTIAFNTVLGLEDGAMALLSGEAIPALGAAMTTALGPIGIITGAVAAMVAGWQYANKESGWIRDLSDKFEYAALRVQGFSAAEADAMIATDHATQKEQEHVASVGKYAEALEHSNVIEGAGIEATEKLGEAHEAGAVKMTAFGKAMEELNSVGTDWHQTLKTIDGSVVEAVQYYLKAGVSQGALKEAYGLTEAQMKALDEEYKESEKWQKEYTAGQDRLTASIRQTSYDLAHQGTLLPGAGTKMVLPSTPLAQMFSTLPTVLSGIVHGPSFSGDLTSAFSDLPSILMKALEGGGGLEGAIKAFATDVGSKLFGEGGALADVTKKATEGLSSMFGKTIGGALGAAIPGIGALIGPAISGLISLIKNIGGPSAAELAGRKVEGDFQSQYGSFDAMMKAVGAGYAAVGKSGDEARKAVENLLAAEKQGGPAAAAALKKITDVLDQQKAIAGNVSAVTAAFQTFGHTVPDSMQPTIQKLLQMNGLTADEKTALSALSGGGQTDFAKLTQMASGYGISLEQLGPKFEQANIDSTAKQIFDDFTDLKNAGADVGGVLSGMSGKISQLVQDSQKFGTAIPNNMRPLLTELAKSGQLTDVQGDKITDVGSLTFEDTPLDNSLQSLNDTLLKLIEALNQIPGAAAAAGNAIGSIPSPPSVGGGYGGVRGAETEIPSFADRPMERVTAAGFALLHPGDYVGVPKAPKAAPNAAGGGGGDTYQFSIPVHALDATGVESYMEKKFLPAAIKVLRGGRHLTDLKQVLS